MSRRALIAIALLFPVALACGPAQPPAPAGPSARERPADDDLLQVVPADAEAVLVLDLAQLRTSRWTRELAATGAAAPGGPGVEEMKNVDLLAVARLASLGEEASLSVARGRFDPEQAAAGFRRARPGARAAAFRGVTVWTAGEEALAFLTERTVISGPVSAVRAAIDASLGRAPAARDQAWLGEVQSALDPGRAGPPAAALAVHVTEPVRARLREALAEAESLERLGARLDLGETLHVSAVGVARSRREASVLAGRLDRLLHGLKLRASLAMLGLLPVLEGTRVSPSGSRVGAELNLNEAQREQIAQRLALLAKALAGRRADREKTP